MVDTNLLGEFLRARRELVAPGGVGLPAAGVRRVRGLRREEVALLAGISADYYLRLEQGRDRHPSAQVLDALARVLGLDAAATDHLHALATDRPRRAPRPRREVVPAGTRQLLDVLGLPAFVEGRFFDVLAANALATTLSPTIVAGRNRLRDAFLDPGERQLWPGHEQAMATFVAGFRAAIGAATDDPRVVQLVGELSLGSEQFRRLWARHDVRVRAGGSVRVRHPQVGAMTLTREKLAVGGTDGQLLVVYHATPGTPDAERLALLGALADTPSSPAPAPEAHPAP